MHAPGMEQRKLPLSACCCIGIAAIQYASLEYQAFLEQLSIRQE